MSWSSRADFKVFFYCVACNVRFRDIFLMILSVLSDISIPFISLALSTLFLSFKKLTLNKNLSHFLSNYLLFMTFCCTYSNSHYHVRFFVDYFCLTQKLLIQLRSRSTERFIVVNEIRNLSGSVYSFDSSTDRICHCSGTT